MAGLWAGGPARPACVRPGFLRSEARALRRHWPQQKPGPGMRVRRHGPGLPSRPGALASEAGPTGRSLIGMPVGARRCCCERHVARRHARMMPPVKRVKKMGHLAAVCRIASATTAVPDIAARIKEAPAPVPTKRNSGSRYLYHRPRGRPACSHQQVATWNGVRSRIMDEAASDLRASGPAAKRS